MRQIKPYKPKNIIRIVTAASLFDGHDAAINIMRRIIQSSGVEVIHLGHNRSVNEIVECVIQEDAQAVAVTSYQGGHMEFFTYMRDLLDEKGGRHVRIFGGGGGVILPGEIRKLQDYGISRIYSPDDGRRMGLQGMVNDLLKIADFPAGKVDDIKIADILNKNHLSIARLISITENSIAKARPLINKISKESEHKEPPVLGIAGTGGAGKSSLIDELVRRFINDFPKKTLAVISVDPSRMKTGGALLGDRIRMNAIHSPNVYMRSLATRQSNLSLSKHLKEILRIVKLAGFDLVILESSGMGQSDTGIVDFGDTLLYVMTPDYGAASQLEKIGMLDFADLVALNKYDKRGGEDALRDVKKQYQRNNQLFDKDTEKMPVTGTIASQFNNQGVNKLYLQIIKLLNSVTADGKFRISHKKMPESKQRQLIIPARRERYLSEIADVIRNYNTEADKQSVIASRLQSLKCSISLLKEDEKPNDAIITELGNVYKREVKLLDKKNLEILENWDKKVRKYGKKKFTYKVRGKEINIETYTKSLSGLEIPKVSLPTFKSWGDILKWNLKENVPGEFPFASGVFSFKREQEDPTRMFAGEGGPERTNKRFHYLSEGMPAKRLSTAFDSVTLYGADPDKRPDIYGKIGNSGVSIACLDDAKRLYSGFNLSDPKTSVSMTINGPAPIMVAYFMNAAIDQQCELYIRENGLVKDVEKKKKEIFKKQGRNAPEYKGKLPGHSDGLGLMLLGVTGDQVLPAEIYKRIKKKTISVIRGTVQADILKEDQAQNTCIFSTEFALKLMGDIQEYFNDNNVRNFYSVSISGYHIAEAGANPVTQLAFTLANGFTFVEYYISRGLDINKFAPNLSFFFSNGLDPEYTVIGRVARIIWAKAMKYKYGANDRSQKLKYHIQTSGRSLHAQEIEFNDIRTTLQALSAIYDNCNSLHTNAYDEAITTPTEESVRRALVIQLIINHELGLAKNQNSLQGSFIIDELTELVEEAVLAEFDRITDRGGVLGAMETMYQRSKIQSESYYYESLKHSGELPIMGVNTFLSSNNSPTIVPDQVTRSTKDEKIRQVDFIHELNRVNKAKSIGLLNKLKKLVNLNQNTFPGIFEAAKYCSIGQISQALYEVGGEYRRNM
ncbi:MAG: methylmalonyl-CoA mutase family protein [Bacteroidales bacterium]|nr:methylmalonyl-CoA mutase family protein [Bacteroidales bacterium]